MIPLGYCQCGCGEQTQAARETRPAKGTVKGRPFRFVHGHNRRKSAVEYVEDAETGCWEWQRSTDGRGGYGKTTHNGRWVHAHIAFYERSIGPVPAGLELDHLCKNKRCVNPAHLEAVTHTENMRRAKHVKLTLELAREIRKSPLCSRLAAEQFGVAAGTIRKVRCGGSWVEPDETDVERDGPDADGSCPPREGSSVPATTRQGSSAPGWVPVSLSAREEAA